MEKIPENLVLLPDNGSALVVDKQSQKIYLWASKQGVYQQKFGFSCSTGEAWGSKSRSGDKKTPEGVYFFTDEYEDKYLSPIYGKKAFPTDYPNYLDKRAGRNGSAIWIHGTNKQLKPMDSNGCIAMNNQDILAVADHIQLHQTPIIIAEEIRLQDEQTVEQLRSRVLDFIDQWKSALEGEDYHSYLRGYGPEYLPEIRWWEQWQTLKERAEKNGNPFSLAVKDPGIYMEKDIFVVTFDLMLTSPSFSETVEKKRFFIRKNGSGFAITGDPGETPARVGQENQFSLLAAGSTLLRKSGPRFQVKTFVKNWLEAWSSKDMAAYSACYSQGFFADGMGKKQWVDRKSRLAEKYSYIRVTGKSFNIQETSGQWVVTFLQNYQASGFSARGIKKLVLVKEEGVWKISQESWKKR
ncbi:MAG: L,D-transpeptidase family protein [Desulfobacteraceae bacterium]